MTEFVREGEMMRALRHPGIVKLLGVCVENGSFYLVHKKVHGHIYIYIYIHTDIYRYRQQQPTYI